MRLYGCVCVCVSVCAIRDIKYVGPQFEKESFKGFTF